MLKNFSEMISKDFHAFCLQSKIFIIILKEFILDIQHFQFIFFDNEKIGSTGIWTGSM